MVDSARYTTETISDWHAWTPKLFSFRTTRPEGFRFVPGQFVRLGVEKADGSEVWRPYSMVSAPRHDYLEFYSIVVPHGEFTTELSRLGGGDKVMVNKVPLGFLTLDRFQGGNELWMLSTGTGLAPFISMLYEADAWRRFEKLVVVHCVRESVELAYRKLIPTLASDAGVPELAERLIYVPVVTREALPGALGHRVTRLIEDGELEAHVGLKFDLERSRVMICGNPEMVDDTHSLLKTRGFALSKRAAPGQIAVEQYW
ncbi:ferredoxin--NADP reductase [Crenobacter cavernae]|uniref:ferredoxin--NADP(+) reductase n=1 Tax=Crenobacter cavernae TaxID=2290923 RepID=A0A345Y805_9NEIS|nr:ferredoxin--NADP reductase [Crenobacter cavernae]AXK40057.1 ferredoxin--NADP reductase [Crenobacter cavernae]